MTMNQKEGLVLRPPPLKPNEKLVNLISGSRIATDARASRPLISADVPGSGTTVIVIKRSDRRLVDLQFEVVEDRGARRPTGDAERTEGLHLFA